MIHKIAALSKITGNSIRELEQMPFDKLEMYYSIYDTWDKQEAAKIDGSR